MKNEGSVLIVEQDQSILDWIATLLKQHVKTVIKAKSACQLPKILKSNVVDVVVLPLSCQGDCSDIDVGVRVLHFLLRVNPDAQVIFMVSSDDLGSTVKIMKEGAIDVISNRFESKELIQKIVSYIGHKDSKYREEQGVSCSPKKQFVYHSERMCELVRTLEKVAPSEANVLILGENGTGKELVAQSIHNLSGRSKGIFMSVDMGALNQGLIENELFGHIKGAYTDARNDVTGRFELANGGTVFLDEIGNLELSVQTKLLTVLEKREVTRVGGNKSHKVDIRLVSATNMMLGDMIDQGEFRRDLLYRLNTVEIALPPLRERQEDIPLLVSYFLEMYCALYHKPLLKIEKSAISYMQNYHWPGNVRELQHVIEKSVILAEGKKLTRDELCQMTNWGAKHELVFASYNLDDIERQVINKVLQMNAGNMTHAADALGLTRASLYRRLQKYQK